MSKKSRKTLRDLYAGRCKRTEPELKPHEVDPNNVMPTQCATCPWREDGGILAETPTTTEVLMFQVLADSNQVCHAPGLQGKPETQICRGARDFQIKVFHGWGVLKEPTDECWKETLEKLKNDDR